MKIKKPHEKSEFLMSQKRHQGHAFTMDSLEGKYHHKVSSSLEKNELQS